MAHLRSIIPSEDAHQSEYVAASDKRREYISGYVSPLHSATLAHHSCCSFTGSAGTAIVSLNNAYLFTDSRYYIQAEREIDRNWTLHKVGTPNVKPWNEWILVSALSWLPVLSPHLCFCPSTSGSLSPTCRANMPPRTAHAAQRSELIPGSLRTTRRLP